MVLLVRLVRSPENKESQRKSGPVCKRKKRHGWKGSFLHELEERKKHLSSERVLQTTFRGRGGGRGGGRLLCI